MKINGPDDVAVWALPILALVLLIGGCGEPNTIEPKGVATVKLTPVGDVVRISTVEFDGRRYTVFQSSQGGLVVFDRGQIEAEKK